MIETNYFKQYVLHYNSPKKNSKNQKTFHSIAKQDITKQNKIKQSSHTIDTQY